MQGRLKSLFEGRWIIEPRGATFGCDVFCPDDGSYDPSTSGLYVEFDLVPDRGMFRATNLRKADASYAYVAERPSDEG